MIMPYKPIDPILKAWAKANSLSWLTTYQDNEVRSIVLNSAVNDRIQIWVDPPTDGRTCVHVFRPKFKTYATQIEKIRCSEHNLATALDAALRVAKEWQAVERK